MFIPDLELFIPQIRLLLSQANLLTCLLFAIFTDEPPNNIPPTISLGYRHQNFIYFPTTKISKLPSTISGRDNNRTPGCPAVLGRIAYLQSRIESYKVNVNGLCDKILKRRISVAEHSISEYQDALAYWEDSSVITSK